MAEGMSDDGPISRVQELDGRFVDPPVVRWAEQVLANAAAETNG